MNFSLSWLMVVYVRVDEGQTRDDCGVLERCGARI
jgi:hypothetical protein